jgi:hypothetical protein
VTLELKRYRICSSQSKLKQLTRVIFVGIPPFCHFPFTTRNRHTMGQHNSQLLDSMVSSSNCTPNTPSILTRVVDKEEIERLRRRFLKLDRDGSGSPLRDDRGTNEQDNWIETSFCRSRRLRIIRLRCG